MLLQIDERHVRGVTLLSVSGRITMLDTTGQLKERVSGLVKNGEKNIVLCLGQLTFVDSSCIGEIVSCSLTKLNVVFRADDDGVSVPKP